mgnify:CR=1 FL=1
MNLNAVIERDLQTGLLVGSVPGLPGAHTQGETIEEVRTNLAEVIELLQAQGALQPELTSRLTKPTSRPGRPPPLPSELPFAPRKA